MQVHMLASFPHYERHLAAIWKHIPDELRGEFVVGTKATARNLPLHDAVMIAGAYDFPRCGDRPVIYVEHGAGQSYHGDRKALRHSNYAGGIHPHNVIGYISPNQTVADSWSKPAFAAGCPALDGVARERSTTHGRWPPRAAITFHFDARLCPETRSARNHYLDELHTMVAFMRSHDFEVIGHHHPRDPMGARIWENLGVRQVSLNELYCTAALLLADNTSVMYEAAALGIPVVALNAPWYRRDVHHGLRFWDMVPGPQIDNYDELFDMKLHSLVDDEEWKQTRAAISRAVYAVDPAKHDAGPGAAAFVCDLVAGK